MLYTLAVYHGHRCPNVTHTQCLDMLFNKHTLLHYWCLQTVVYTIHHTAYTIAAATVTAVVTVWILSRSCTALDVYVCSNDD
jgi:hypothetical protein